MSDGETTENVPATSHSAENPRLVAAALACVWFAVGSVVLGMGLILAIQGSRSGMVLGPIIVTLMLLQIPGVIAVLVLSILGGMWRGVLDSVMAAVLLVLTVGADLMLWPLTTSQPSFGPFSSDGCDGSGPCTSNANLWIGVGVQTLVLAIILVCSAHWVWRLRPESAQQNANRLGLLAVAALFVAALVAIDSNIDTSSSSNPPRGVVPNFGSSNTSIGSGSTARPSQAQLQNDLGKTVRVVFCPRQDCHGRSAQAMNPGGTATFTGSSGAIPDSFVVLGDGSAPKCQTTDGWGGSPGVGLATQPLSSADAQTCGMDVETLTVAH